LSTALQDARPRIESPSPADASRQGTGQRPSCLSYVLPVRRCSVDPPPAELTGYVRWLSGRVDLIVVDNSEDDVFAVNAAAWSPFARHVRPVPSLRCLQHKVANVRTGLALARSEVVIVADDDVRWDEQGLLRAWALAQDSGAVRPQNFFSPLPWHARWDTARMLINRATGGDYPGTLVVRKRVIEMTGGYDGDLLFENLELLRTVEAAGARVINAPDLFVRRLPPSSRHFFSQRIRQAYDDFAVPLRMATWLSLAPLSLWLRAWRNPKVAAVGIGTSVAVAEIGRRRAGGTQVFPASATLFAPLWLAERAICAWLALGAWIWHGGVRYNGKVIARAAHSRRQLRRMMSGRVALATEMEATTDDRCSGPAGPAQQVRY
jgi:hypothetical protein